MDRGVVRACRRAGAEGVRVRGAAGPGVGSARIVRATSIGRARPAALELRHVLIERGPHLARVGRGVGARAGCPGPAIEAVRASGEAALSFDLDACADVAR